MTAAFARFAALVCAVAALAAAAQEPRKFAALSIIGDRLLVVNHVGETGTRVDVNRTDALDMPPRAIDNAVLGAVAAAIKRSAQGSEVVMLGATPPLFQAQGSGVEDPDVKPVVDLVRPAIASAGVTHLVLVSKLRHEARLKFADGNVGSGRLEGLGFYLDHQLLTQERGKGNVGRGFIAPYAYFRVSLVDARSGEVLAFRDVLASQAVGAGRSPSLQVWEALSADEKARMVVGLARRESARAVQEMLAKP